MTELCTYFDTNVYYFVSKNRFHTMPTLLAGNLSSGYRMFRGDFEPIAQTKYKNFERYARLYPEFSFVFIGDNGQGDVRTAFYVFILIWVYD